ncbi:hypothetical protein C7447_102122 [Tenacibaculum adriaticum]|uniref:Uncharacterized protein n=1 Tax=Tenacibaculum adriaticum TaxID=413713 RepID=A0A5S5DSE2_9FLAO|nr:hypothetical protein [Tenacibaculum adriaticum]TYP98807.1 hypothetical protein C7447_102122 [Tenacibaculum adriaticum]
MKYTILLLLTFSFCKNDLNFNKRLVESFCEKIILNDNITFYDTTKYVRYSSEFLDSKNKHEIVMSILKNLRTQLSKNNNDYEIINHEKLLKTNNFKVLKFSNEYKKLNTYHLISRDSIITSFIIRDRKIISFSYNIIKNIDQVKTPLIL